VVMKGYDAVVGPLRYLVTRGDLNLLRKKKGEI
jgi:hypothetical protein